MPGRDAAERAQLLRITVLLGPAVLIIGGFTIFFLAGRKLIPSWAAVALLLLLPYLAWRIILLVETATDRASAGLLREIFAARAEPTRTGFSRQEALAARGRLEEAAAAYRAHLLAVPGDVTAYVALARLLAGPLGDFAGAEEAWLSARRLRPGPDWDRVITDDLIDLYQRTDQEGRLQVELARYADTQRGSRAGEAAGRRLRELKERERYED